MAESKEEAADRGGIFQPGWLALTHLPTPHFARQTKPPGGVPVLGRPQPGWELNVCRYPPPPPQTHPPRLGKNLLPRRCFPHVPFSPADGKRPVQTWSLLRKLLVPEKWAASFQAPEGQAGAGRQGAGGTSADVHRPHQGFSWASEGSFPNVMIFTFNSPRSQSAGPRGGGEVLALTFHLPQAVLSPA